MSSHRRSIDTLGIFSLALDAREIGATHVQNQAFAVLLRAALEGHPHLYLRLYTNDRFGEKDPKSRRRLIAVHHAISGRRIRAPFRLLTKIATEWVLLVLGDEDMADLEPGRGAGKTKEPPTAEIGALETRLRSFGVPIPDDMLEGVGNPTRKHVPLGRTLATAT